MSCVLLALASPAWAQVDVPALSARVTDLTGTLDASQSAALESKLAALEQRKGAQVAILLLPSTQPETIEQFAVRAFEHWRLGRGKVDDGVLLIVAKDDRKVRIEVGYGLEGAIPDVSASRVINEYLTPHFREGKFYTGIDAATDALLHLIDGEPLPEPYQAPDRGSGLSTETQIGIGFWAALIFNLLFGRLHLVIRVVVVSALVAGLALLLGASLQGAMFGGIVCAFAIAALGSRGSPGRGGGWSSRGGWASGAGWGSGGGWSSGGGGGGFSGGGGSSGGGGASGSW